MSWTYLPAIPVFLFVLWIFSYPLGTMDETASFAPAVGVSLTATYGTMSIRNGDGSFQDIARSDGDDRYIQLMQRLSSANAKHPSPPYNTIEDMWSDWRRQLWRSARKRLSLPASSDVGILSDMIRTLLEKGPACLPSSSRKSAVVSYPGIVALYNEDIVDAAEYLGLDALKGHHLNQPREMVAAYAGHGLGLCRSYYDREKCTEEGRKLPEHHTLLVEYTEHALLLHVAIMRQAIDLAWSDIDATASFELGSDSNQQYGHADRVKDLVLELLRKTYSLLGPPKEILVIMTGSANSVGDSAVQKAIMAGVEELGSAANMLTSMPEHVASRGAAELAWRALSLPNSA